MTPWPTVANYKTLSTPPRSGLDQPLFSGGATRPSRAAYLLFHSPTSQRRSVSAERFRLAQHVLSAVCLFTTGSPAPSLAQAVNQRCDVGLGSEKKFDASDRSRLGWTTRIAKNTSSVTTHQLILCRSMISSFSSALSAWLLLPPTSERGC